MIKSQLNRYEIWFTDKKYYKTDMKYGLQIRNIIKLIWNMVYRFTNKKYYKTDMKYGLQIRN